MVRIIKPRRQKMPFNHVILLKARSFIMTIRPPGPAKDPAEQLLRKIPQYSWKFKQMEKSVQ